MIIKHRYMYTYEYIYYFEQDEHIWWSLMFLSQLIWNDLWHEVQMVVFFCDFGCRQWHTIGISCTIGGCGVREAPRFGKWHSSPMTRQVIRCVRIDGLSKLQLVGLTPRHNATALAIAKIPQSIPFDCCVTSSHSRCKMSPSVTYVMWYNCSFSLCDGRGMGWRSES